MPLDITFDFRTDVIGDRDPDAFSPTLQRYHQLLWSKLLPSGDPFDLTPNLRPPYTLVHDSRLGRFELSSDTVLPSFADRAALQAIIGQMPSAAVAELSTLRYTIGGMMMWPCVMIDGNQTINQARGWNALIADRFDLTVECIRRHYAGDTTHPLADTFGLYSAFFDLFGSFAGYVEFWLLEDLVELDGTVRLFLPSDGFTLRAVPKTLADYTTFCERTVEFVKARNRRIQRLAS
ncbi:MAG: hypothetical protein WCC60_03550 [Ilumatobacteraceae bacterium]